MLLLVVFFSFFLFYIIGRLEPPKKRRIHDNLLEGNEVKPEKELLLNE